MPLTGNFGVEAPEKKEWVVVPEDVYQAVIKDIDEKDSTKYQSDEMEVQYLLKFVILDGKGPESQLQSVTAFASRKWFTGNKKTSPSKLVNLVSAVYAFYYPKIKVTDLTAEDMTPAVINDLIGKQVRITVKVTESDNGPKNKIADFMSIKEELALPEDVKVAEVAKKMVAKPKKGDGAKEEVKTEEGKSDLPF